jgi:hypothetical protein
MGNECFEFYFNFSIILSLLYILYYYVAFSTFFLYVFGIRMICADEHGICQCYRTISKASKSTRENRRIMWLIEILSKGPLAISPMRHADADR